MNLSQLIIEGERLHRRGFCLRKTLLWDEQAVGPKQRVTIGQPCVRQGIAGVAFYGTVEELYGLLETLLASLIQPVLTFEVRLVSIRAFRMPFDLQTLSLPD